jgi:hypothetical protein
MVRRVHTGHRLALIASSLLRASLVKGEPLRDRLRRPLTNFADAQHFGAYEGKPESDRFSLFFKAFCGSAGKEGC